MISHHENGNEATATRLRPKSVANKLVRIFIAYEVLALVLNATGGMAQGKKKFVYPIEMRSDFVCFHQGNTSVDYWLSISSGDFFKGLEWDRVQAHDEFRKKRQLVKSYPDELRVLVRFDAPSILGCRGDPPVRQMLNAEHKKDIQDLLASLNLEASWKSRESTESSPGSLRTPFHLVGPTDIRYGSMGWTYESAVQSNGVPLTDILVVSAFGTQHRFLGRIEFDLTSPLNGIPSP